MNDHKENSMRLLNAMGKEKGEKVAPIVVPKSRKEQLKFMKDAFDGQRASVQRMSKM